MKQQQFCPRQKEVISLIAEGCANKEIAARMGITYGTVRGYIYRIFGILNLENRTQVAIWAIKNGADLDTTTTRTVV